MFTVPQSQSAYGVGNEVLGLPASGMALKAASLPRNEVEQCRLEASAIKLNEAYQTAFEKCNLDLRTVAEQPLRHFWQACGHRVRRREFEVSTNQQ